MCVFMLTSTKKLCFWRVYLHVCLYKGVENLTERAVQWTYSKTNFLLYCPIHKTVYPCTCFTPVYVFSKSKEHLYEFFYVGGI